jgi:hypothetical protein
MRRYLLLAVLAVASACAPPAGPSGNQGVSGPQGLPGATGSAGPAGPQGSRGANWVGGWSPLTRYQIDDAVDHLGSSYVAVGTPVLGLAPPSTEWQLDASVGATGAEGPQGPQGDTGAQGLPGLGSVVLIDTGPGLTGGPITASGAIGIAAGGVTNAMLASSAVTVNAGSGLTGGGLVSLGGTVSLSSADLAGDVNGSPIANTVTALQGSPVLATTPADGQVLAFSAGAASWAPKTLVIPQLATYRYAVFRTYDYAGGPMANNDATLFGGVAPTAWSAGNAVAAQMSPDKEVLRTFFGKKGYAGSNALVHAESYLVFTSASGMVAVVLFRIRNNTASAITWTPVFRATAYSSWGDLASVALNGVAAWSSGGGNYPATAGPFSVALTIPANRVSSAIFVANGGPYSSGPSGILSRSTLLAFVSNSLALPSGLQFVDDLDTATGDWTQ